MLNIFYGRENLDKEKFIFEKVGDRALIMVPDQYTLEAERQAFRHLGVSSLMDVEIVSAASLGGNILSELGRNKRSFINKYGRHMLLYKSAASLGDDLKVFRGMERKSSFLDSVNDFISEMKQYNCGPKDLLAMAESIGEDSYTGKKLTDIYALFSEYEKQIEGRYTDSEDYIDLYLGKIKDSALIRDNTVWVYGFDSFAPKTMALLGQLMMYAKEVNIVLTWDDRGRDLDLFALTEIVMNNAEKLADSLGTAHIRQRIPDSFAQKEKAEAVRHIEKELYTLPSAVSNCHEGLIMTEAAGIYNEAESAAAYVLHLVRDKGLRYRDIRLIYNDLENRGDIIERVFEEYGIELFSDMKRDIMDSPIIKYITSLLDVVIEKYRTETLLSLLKSGFGDLSGEELSDLENYAVKYKIRGSMWKKPFRRGSAEYGEAGLSYINMLRQKAVDPIKPLEKIFETETTGEFIRLFYDYLCGRMALRQKILAFIARQEEKELWDLADETAQIWESLSDILDQIFEIMGEEPFEPEAFREIFEVGLSQVEIGLLPPTQDGLILGNIQRSRSGRVKALIVMGANEGILPQERPTQGLFSAEERELFREDGRELCKVDAIRFMEERLSIYRNLSSPSDYLWISCSLTDEEGGQMKPSGIFLKVRELFPGIEIRRDMINGDDDLLISGGIGARRHISRKILEAGEGALMDDRWQAALGWLENNMPDQAQEIRRSISFTNRQEQLGSRAAAALFGKDPYQTLALSPSRIEGYSRCPFSHLVTYGLRPEERRVFEAAQREIGDIYHRCLMGLARELTVPGIQIFEPDSPWMKITKEECAQLVEREIESIAETYREGLFQSGSVEDYRRRRITDICASVCFSVVEQVRAGHISQISPEIAFGRKGDLPPIEMEAGGQKIYIEGVIDRVDYLTDGRVKIVDYKTGNESFDIEEAAAGYRLQLMLYLNAACGSGRKPAGVFYFKIKEPSIDLSQKDMDSQTLEKEIRKSFKLDGIMVDDPQVIRDIAGDFEGFSEIVPIRSTKDGIKNTGKGGLLSAEDFTHLQGAVTEKIRQICSDLTEGKIEIHPMKTKDRSACTFCRYKGICRFDTVFEGCSYNII